MQQYDADDRAFERSMMIIAGEQGISDYKLVQLPSGDWIILPIERNHVTKEFCVSAYLVRPKKPNRLGEYNVYNPDDECIDAARKLICADLGEKTPFFSNIEIAPKARGKGISQLLTDYALEEIRNKKLLHVVQFKMPLGVERMKPKYERLGYHALPVDLELWTTIAEAQLKADHVPFHPKDLHQIARGDYAGVEHLLETLPCKDWMQNKEY